MLSAQWNGIKLSVLHLEAETFPMQNTVFRSLMIHCCLYFETLEIKIYIFVYFRFSFFFWLFIHFCTSLILFSSMICAQKYEFIRAHRRPKTYREQRKWEGCNNRQNQHLVVESTYRLIFIAVVGIQFHWASYWTPAFRQTQISIE